MMLGRTLRPAATLVMTGSLAWLLRRAGQDYELRGRLSPEASAFAWVLYSVHASMVVASSWRSAWPLPVSRGPAVALGGLLLIAGSWLFGADVREFRSFGQVSGVETGRLITSGPYRYSRNPQVVGWGLALLGAAVAGRSFQALLLVIAFLLVHRLHLPTEERHLERAFGEEYRCYRAKAPRFLGFPKDG